MNALRIEKPLERSGLGESIRSREIRLPLSRDAQLSVAASGWTILALAKPETHFGLPHRCGFRFRCTLRRKVDRKSGKVLRRLRPNSVRAMQPNARSAVKRWHLKGQPRTLNSTPLEAPQIDEALPKNGPPNQPAFVNRALEHRLVPRDVKGLMVIRCSRSNGLSRANCQITLQSHQQHLQLSCPSNSRTCSQQGRPSTIHSR